MSVSPVVVISILLNKNTIVVYLNYEVIMYSVVKIEIL